MFVRVIPAKITTARITNLVARYRVAECLLIQGNAFLKKRFYHLLLHLVHVWTQPQPQPRDEISK